VRNGSGALSAVCGLCVALGLRRRRWSGCRAGLGRWGGARRGRDARGGGIGVDLADDLADRRALAGLLVDGPKHPRLRRRQLDARLLRLNLNDEFVLGHCVTDRPVPGADFDLAHRFAHRRNLQLYDHLNHYSSGLAAATLRAALAPG
jgi:hypothetical protein